MRQTIIDITPINTVIALGECEKLKLDLSHFSVCLSSQLLLWGGLAFGGFGRCHPLLGFPEKCRFVAVGWQEEKQE